MALVRLHPRRDVVRGDWQVLGSSFSSELAVSRCRVARLHLQFVIAAVSDRLAATAVQLVLSRRLDLCGPDVDAGFALCDSGGAICRIEDCAIDKCVVSGCSGGLASSSSDPLSGHFSEVALVRRGYSFGVVIVGDRGHADITQSGARGFRSDGRNQRRGRQPQRRGISGRSRSGLHFIVGVSSCSRSLSGGGSSTTAFEQEQPDERLFFAVSGASCDLS